MEGGADIRIVTEGGKIIAQKKRRIKNIDFTIGQKLQLRLSFSMEELLEKENEFSKNIKFLFRCDKIQGKVILSSISVSVFIHKSYFNIRRRSPI